MSTVTDNAGWEQVSPAFSGLPDQPDWRQGEPATETASESEKLLLEDYPAPRSGQFRKWCHDLYFSPLRRRVLAFALAVIPSFFALYFLLFGLQKSETAVLQFSPWGSGLGMIEIISGLGLLFLVIFLAGRISSSALIPFFVGTWITNLVVFFSSESWLLDLKATIGWSSCTSALTAMSLGGLYSCWLNRLDSPYLLQHRREICDHMAPAGDDLVPATEKSTLAEAEITTAERTVLKPIQNISEGAEENPDPSQIRLPGNRKSWIKALIISLVSAISMLITLIFQAGMVEADYNTWVLEDAASPILTILVTCAITFGSVFLTGAASFAVMTPLLVTVIVLMVPALVFSVADLVSMGHVTSHPDVSALSIMSPVCGILGAVAFMMILASFWAKHSPHYQAPSDINA